MLSSKIQRTKIESKSQPKDTDKTEVICCHQKYKEQKLKANHNYAIQHKEKGFVVIKNTKNKN